MTVRSLTATIQRANGSPWEGVQVDFLPEIEGHDAVSARTDAGGVFMAALETGVPYAVSFIGAQRIDGIQYAAVTVIYLTVPAGRGTATLAEFETLTLSTDWPVLLRRLVGTESGVQNNATRLAATESTVTTITSRIDTALETRINGLEARIVALEGTVL